MWSGAVMPRRTLSPRMSTTVIVTSSPIVMVSLRPRDSTSMADSFQLFAIANDKKPVLLVHQTLVAKLLSL